MHGVVFWCGDRLEVLGIVSLQTANERDAEPASQVGIFAVGFLTSSPPRIAKDVDVWRPEGQTEVPRVVAVGYRVVVLGARFGRNDVAHAMHEIFIPSCAQSDSLRKN